VLPNVRVEERAEGKDLELLASGVLERLFGQGGCDPVSLESVRDLGVHDGDQTGSRVIFGEACDLAVDERLVALLIRVVANLDGHGPRMIALAARLAAGDVNDLDRGARAGRIARLHDHHP
jgi:hypothetical protein